MLIAFRRYRIARIGLFPFLPHLPHPSIFWLCKETKVQRRNQTSVWTLKSTHHEIKVPAPPLRISDSPSPQWWAHPSAPLPKTQTRLQAMDLRDTTHQTCSAALPFLPPPPCLSSGAIPRIRARFILSTLRRQLSRRALPTSSTRFVAFLSRLMMRWADTQKKTSDIHLLTCLYSTSCHRRALCSWRVRRTPKAVRHQKSPSTKNYITTRRHLGILPSRCTSFSKADLLWTRTSRGKLLFKTEFEVFQTVTDRAEIGHSRRRALTS